MNPLDERGSANDSSSAPTLRMEVGDAASAPFDAESLLHEFEAAWQTGRIPPLAAILACLPQSDAAGEQTQRLLEKLIKTDLEYRWRTPAEVHGGDLPTRPLLEDYAFRFPSLGPLSGLPLDLIGEEYRVRRTWGDRPESATYRVRFPVQAECLMPLLARIDAELREQSCASTLPTGRPNGEPSRSIVPADYRILGELGRGGMGVVYKARQISLNRLVAIKMVHGGEAAGTDVIARFHIEAEAAARVPQAHAVQVYEVGEHDGQPYCVMEYVNGGSLAALLDGTPLEPRAAASVLETLARAVQAVHEQGILHRDLKPSNILLQLSAISEGAISPAALLQSPTSTLKISDFGLAKRTEAVGLTYTGAVLGSPCYMAPEQASGHSHELGPTVDVYGLGAILYELLTGRPPFRGSTVLETLAQVRALEPTPPRRLVPAIPRDVDTICLKCLHKESRKRYATAVALAEDLARFRQNRPVTARPAGRWERGWKWAKRRPALATLLSALFLGLLAALGGGAVYTVQLREAHTETRRHQEQSTRNYRKALQAVEQMLHRLGAERMSWVPGTEQLQEEALLDAVRLYEELQNDQSQADADLSVGLARALTQLANLQLSLDRTEEAEKNCRRGVELMEGLPESLRAQRDCRGQLAFGQYSLGTILAARDQRSEAARQYEQALRICQALAAEHRPARLLRINCLAGLEGVCGDPDQAAEHNRQALQLCEALHQEDPSDWSIRHLLGQSLFNTAVARSRGGKPEEAEPLFRRCAALLEADAMRTPRHSGDHGLLVLTRAVLLNTYNGLAMWYGNRGQTDKAETYYRKAITIGEESARLYPQLPRQHSLAQTHLNLGSLYQTTHRHKEAEAQYRLALAILEPLARERPRLAGHRLTMAFVCTNLGHLLSFEHPKEGLAVLHKGREVLEGLWREYPNDPQYGYALGSLYSNLAQVLRNQGRLREALPWHHRAVDVAEGAYRCHPANGAIQRTCINAHGTRAVTWEGLGEYKNASADWKRLVELAGPAEGEGYRLFLALDLARMGDHRRAVKETDQMLLRPNLSNDNRYNCSCVLSHALTAALRDPQLSSEERQKAADGYAVRALEILERLRCGGYFKKAETRKQLDTDNDMQALRARQDFQRWRRKSEPQASGGEKTVR